MTLGGLVANQIWPLIIGWLHLLKIRGRIAAEM
jgi:hypothetical protein